MMYIGIDPEPSGAWCTWDTRFGDLHFYTSFPKTRDRVEQFLKRVPDFVTAVFIEDTITIPYMNITAASKYYKSFGVWEGIIESVLPICETSILKIPPKKWKKALGLSKDKQQSYELALEIIKNPKYKINPECLEELKLSPKCPEKQVYDRCEAFLIAYYGRYYILGDGVLH